MTDHWDTRAADAWERHLAWGRDDRVTGDDEEQDEQDIDVPDWWDEEEAR